MSQELMVGLTLVLGLGMLAQWLAWRLRLPSILLLLLFGFAAGRGAAGLLDPDVLFGDLLLPIVSLSAALILFEGGLSLDLRDLGSHGREIGKLVTLGLLVTWVLASVAAWLLLPLALEFCVLLGAILTVSGPTVVQPLLRHIRPQGATAPILRWEGIVIDPIGALLAVLIVELILTGVLSHGLGEALPHAALQTLRTIGVGGVLGVAGAWLLQILLQRYWIPDHLHNPVALALVLGIFVGANLLEAESGLLAVTLMGVVLANRSSVSLRHIVEFKENVRVLLLSGVFVILAARLRFADFEGMDAGAFLFVAILLFVVRPAGVWLSTRGSSLTTKERIFLSWMFPRGIVAAAVASLFTLELAAAGIPGGERLVPLTFLVIVSTVAVYGLTAGPLAVRLGLSTPNPQGVVLVGAHRWARELAATLKEAGVAVLLVDSNRHNLAAARQEGLPTWYGNALSDHAEEEMDLAGMGHLVALTPNDEVNTLIALHYLHLFGRNRVYQLAAEAGSSRKGGVTELRGRTLFAEGIDYWRLTGRHQAGARLKATKLTDQFGLAEFRAQHGENALLLMSIENGRVRLGTTESEFTPGAGQTVVALVDPEPSKPADDSRPD